MSPRIERDLIARLEQAGYTDVRDVERKKRHIEVEARNPAGRQVEVHMHMDGRIEEDD